MTAKGWRTNVDLIVSDDPDFGWYSHKLVGAIGAKQLGQFEQNVLKTGAGGEEGKFMKIVRMIIGAMVNG